MTVTPNNRDFLRERALECRVRVRLSLEPHG